MCASYNGVSVPIEIAFEEINEELDSHAALHAMDVISDIIFIIDIVVGFLTAYIDTSSGDSISNPRKIARRYMQSGFAFDFLSSLPFIVSPLLNQYKSIMNLLGVFRIFKLIRLRKIDQVIANLHSDKNTKT